jgi:hypothetical protein
MVFNEKYIYLMLIHIFNVENLLCGVFNEKLKEVRKKQFMT